MTIKTPINKTVKTDAGRALIYASQLIHNFDMAFVSVNRNDKIEVRTFAGKNGRVKLLIAL